MRNAAIGLFVLAISLSGWELQADDAAPPAPDGGGPTRLFFAPTARSQPRGGVSLGLTEIAFPWVEVGIWDRFSVQAVPLLLGELTGTGLVVAPKLQVVRSRHVQAAIG